MKKLFLILTLIVVSFTFLSADVYIKSKTHTGAIEIMGQKQPAKDDFSETWIGDGIMSTTSKGSKFIITSEKMIMITDSDKTYVEIALPFKLSSILPEGAEQMASMMKMKLSITPNGQTKKIGKWNCTGYDMSLTMMMGALKGVIWASTEVPFKWKKFQDLQKYVQMVSFIEGLEEYKKVKGYQIASEMSMNMMGAEINVKSEVMEIAEKKAPAGIYSVPAGYTKKDKMSLPKMGGR
ncbi:MAG: hypothetical protein KAT34_00230 [Candidatus Aminicenantes bacterium]|nr:hypothetical protein [Candidatus Aminicenantes bacterium]